MLLPNVKFADTVKQTYIQFTLFLTCIFDQQLPDPIYITACESLHACMYVHEGCCADITITIVQIYQ